MTEEQGKKKSTRKNDLIFVSVLLALLLLAILALLLFRGEGDTVTVTVDGTLFGEYSLTENRTVEIPSGNGFNRLVIRDGKARMEYADCPDGICVSHRPILYNGQSIICLPNEVVVTVQRKQGDRQPDIIV